MKNCGQKGFTLIELLIVVAISGLIMGGVYSIFVAQEENYVMQEQVADLQQNLRAAMYIMSRDIRMAGFDPEETKDFGFSFIGFRDTNNAPDVAGFSAIEFTADLDEDGRLEDGVANPSQADLISYSVYDYPVGLAPPEGNRDLARDTAGSGRQLLAENIENMGLAYAFDADGDGWLDRDAGGQVIWAIDENNDGRLDKNLDTNGDGDIDNNDCAAPGAANCTITGTAIAGVNMEDIRAVRIWLLARSPRADQNFVNTDIYVVGRQVVTPNDAFRRRLLEGVVKCRNMGLGS